MEELDFRLHVIFLKRWRIYIFCGGGKEGKYLEKEKIFGEEKILVGEAKFAGRVDTNRLKALQEVLVDLTIKSLS